MNTVDTVEKSFKIALANILSKQLIISALYVVLAFVMIAVLNRASRKYRDKIDPEDVRLRSFVHNGFNIVKFVVVLICAFAILQANGINISSMVTGVGLISAIAGLAMQDFFKDVIMGIHIVNDHSVVVDDVVEINGIEGTVLSFSLVSTILQDLNTGNVVTMCNRNITQVAKVKGIYVIDLNLTYSEDPERVRSIFTKAAKDIQKLKGITKADYLGIHAYGDSGVVYRIRFFCSPKIHWPMYREAMGIVQKYVISEKLEIPYPQMDVHQR